MYTFCIWWGVLINTSVPAPTLLSSPPFPPREAMVNPDSAGRGGDRPPRPSPSSPSPCQPSCPIAPPPPGAHQLTSPPLPLQPGSGARVEGDTDHVCLGIPAHCGAKGGGPRVPEEPIAAAPALRGRAGVYLSGQHLVGPDSSLPAWHPQNSTLPRGGSEPPRHSL